jgi:uncharacterized protein YbjT (DUF2867 family)
MHALVIGATGATGKDLVEKLLQDERITRVAIFVRRPGGLVHEKLHVHVVDFEKPAEWAGLVKGDVLFSALGATLKAAGGKVAQWQIDYGYQYGFAKAASENQVPVYVLVSAVNASPKSIFFYSRMKGALEEAVKGLSFRSATIFRPPILVRKGSDRAAEVAGIKVLKLLNRIGLFHSQAPLKTETLAEAMINGAMHAQPGIEVVEGAAIRKLADEP